MAAPNRNTSTDDLVKKGPLAASALNDAIAAEAHLEKLTNRDDATVMYRHTPDAREISAASAGLWLWTPRDPKLAGA